MNYDDLEKRQAAREAAWQAYNQERRREEQRYRALYGGPSINWKAFEEAGGSIEDVANGDDLVLAAKAKKALDRRRARDARAGAWAYLYGDIAFLECPYCGADKDQQCSDAIGTEYATIVHAARLDPGLMLLR